MGAAGAKAAPPVAAPGKSRCAFDTACAVTCFRPDFGVGAAETRMEVNLQQAGGAPLETSGVVREVALHSGRAILPSKGVVADVTRNLLAAHAYVGPGKKHAGWLHGNQSLLIPREEFPAEVAAIDALVAKVAKAGRAVPLCWRQQTLALGLPVGKPEDAHRLGGGVRPQPFELNVLPDALAILSPSRAGSDANGLAAIRQHKLTFHAGTVLSWGATHVIRLRKVQDFRKLELFAGNSRRGRPGMFSGFFGRPRDFFQAKRFGHAPGIRDTGKYTARRSVAFVVAEGLPGSTAMVERQAVAGLRRQR